MSDLSFESDGEINKNLGQYIKSVGKILKLRQADIANSVGCTQGAISKIMRGEGSRSASIIRILYFLQTELKKKPRNKKEKAIYGIKI